MLVGMCPQKWCHTLVALRDGATLLPGLMDPPQSQTAPAQSAWPRRRAGRSRSRAGSLREHVGRQPAGRLVAGRQAVWKGTHHIYAGQLRHTSLPNVQAHELHMQPRRVAGPTAMRMGRHAAPGNHQLHSNQQRMATIKLCMTRADPRAGSQRRGGGPAPPLG